jgi:hypothetical protein
MRRWVSLVLLVLLPLQLSWAAAASYCQHESGPGTVAHFGHHEHEHEPPHADGAPAGDHAVAEASHDGPDTKLPLVDHDCAYCHLGSAHALHVSFEMAGTPIGESFAGEPGVSKPGFIPSRLERPNWRTA